MIDYSIIEKLPKVELHDHLDGGLRVETLWELSGKYGKKLPADSPGNLKNFIAEGCRRRSLALYLEAFSYTTAVMQTEYALKRIAYEALEDLASDGVVYAELRFAPEQHTGEGLSLTTIIQAVLSGMKEAETEFGIVSGLIICAMRNQSHSIEIAEKALEFRNGGVVGFDIAGDEYNHPAKKHLRAFELIRKNNFNITIHAGEAFGPESIWQSLQLCGAHRIGHGTRLIESIEINENGPDVLEDLPQFIKDRRIPLEVCLSSNIQTGAADSVPSHPFHYYFKNNFRVFLCTDNRLMSQTSLSREYHLASEHYGLSIDQMEKLVINGMKSAFIHYDRRVDIIYSLIKPAYKKLKTD